MIGAEHAATVNPSDFYFPEIRMALGGVARTRLLADPARDPSPRRGRHRYRAAVRARGLTPGCQPAVWRLGQRPIP